MISALKTQKPKSKKKTEGKTQRGKQASIDPLGKNRTDLCILRRKDNSTLLPCS